MAGDIEVALIAGGSALLGGVISAVAGTRVERLRYKASMTEKAELRKVDAVQRFAAAATAWFEWLAAIKTNKRLTVPQLLDENNARSKERQQAYRQLRLFCSDEMNVWLEANYEPVELSFIDTYSWPMIRLLIGGQSPPFEDDVLPPGADAARERYQTFLREEMNTRFREEVAKLREP